MGAGGVGKDVGGLNTEPFPMIYWDHRQHQPFQQMTLVVRSEQGAMDIVPSLRAVLRDLDPELPLYNVRSMVRVGVAVIIGAAGAFALTRLLESLVFDVSTADPATFVAMAMLLAITGLVACWLPARRASGIDPVEAIRTE